MVSNTDRTHVGITRADKSIVTVVMFKDEYVTKLDHLLSDESTYSYIELHCNPIKNNTEGLQFRLK